MRRLWIALLFSPSLLAADVNTHCIGDSSSPGGIPYVTSTGICSTTAAGTSGQCFKSNGANAPTWGACAAGAGYATIENQGTALAQETTLNFIGSALTAADNAGQARTDVTLSESPSSASVVGTGRTLNAGAGIAAIGDLSADRTISTASGTANFLASGALTCGAGTQGEMQVHTTPLQYCDNAATPVLRYAAYGDSSGNATLVPAANVTGQVAIGNGGTGAASASAGFDALAPTTTRGDLIARGASSNARLALGSNGQCLTSNGTDPAWGSCGVASAGDNFSAPNLSSALVANAVLAQRTTTSAATIRNATYTPQVAGTQSGTKSYTFKLCPTTACATTYVTCTVSGCTTVGAQACTINTAALPAGTYIWFLSATTCTTIPTGVAYASLTYP